MKHLMLGAAAAALTATGALADPAIWKVSDDNSQVWLFGSIHYLDAGTQWRTDTLNAAIESADFVYYETPMTPEAQAQAQQLIPKYGLNPEGVTLSSLLSEEQFAELEAVAGELGIPVQNLEPVRPWLAGLQLSLIALQRAGYNPQSGVDMVLSQATDDEKERYFETLEEQLQFLSSQSDDVAVKGFMVTLDQLDEAEEFFGSLVSSWAAGDLETFEATFYSAMSQVDPALYDTLIVRRNEAWVEDLKAFIAEDDDAVIVVGAGHLVGDDSVVNLLESEGFSVERVQ